MADDMKIICIDVIIINITLSITILNNVVHDSCSAYSISFIRLEHVTD